MTARDVLLTGVLVFTFAIIFFVSYFALNTVFTKMIENPQINSSTTAVNVLTKGASLTNRFDFIILAIFIGLIAGLIVSSWFVAGNPIFMFIYFVVVVVSIIGSAILSNIWETVSGTSIFGLTIAHFPITNNIITHLPLYMMAIGFIGLVVMFGKPFMVNNQ